ncbi:MAG: lactonase family protein [Anaerolineae bacterium]|nr:lactonase family protein [Anaerolineae bacterium]
MTDPRILYIGTYTAAASPTGRRSEGIYRFWFDTTTGALTLAGVTGGIANPSWLAFHPHGRYLYAGSEVREHGRRSGGAAVAYGRDPATGELTRLNDALTGGAGPCYLSLDPSGRLLLVANYASGSLTVFPVRADGRLEPAAQIIQHAGSGPVTDRQEGPHAHCIVPDPSGRFALAADLGIDQVLIYRLDVNEGRLSPAEPPCVELPPGTGPRHIAFHPHGRWFYVTGELNSTLTTCAWDAKRGRAERVQIVSTLPEGWTGTNYPAEVAVAASGRFVYMSNRGHDSIAIYAVDAATGQLTPAGHVATQGAFPRHFALDPTGAFMLVANQNSDNVVVFRVDGETGQLTPTGHAVTVPSPVCVRFAG